MFVASASGFPWPRRQQSKAEHVSTLPKTLTIAAKAAAIGCGVVIAIPGCSPPNTPVRQIGKPTPGITAGSLIVSVDDVRRIAGVSNLSAAPGSDTDQPRHYNSNLPAPCQAVFDQQSAFDGNWDQFDSATYSADIYTGQGETRIRRIADVGQAVAVYPDENTARNVFDRLVANLKQCLPLHVRNYNYTIENTGPATVALNTAAWEVIYQMKSSTLINVAAIGVERPERTARSVVQTIADRIK
jgi:hypothetical protein